ncbi:hypothetical protein Z042_03390 [Chania multitudinisentens RB-25]|uniref:Uncharacterized protein n=1 Tax=Chania multitudinisentens RB-25 TaxID=1441930 RepID=W0LJX1_9GAMM|nr:hypothetical protein Z042_03390 [Chania multitudinisentens RB-25]
MVSIYLLGVCLHLRVAVQSEMDSVDDKQLQKQSDLFIVWHVGIRAEVKTLYLGFYLIAAGFIYSID